MKRITAIVCFIVLLFLPVCAVPCVLAGSGTQYSETYYAALGKQYDRLCSTEGEKVIVVGGSNIAFGLDSELFESLYGSPSIAFGLYGSLGVKVMMDLSKADIGKGDIVVLAPEISAEATSLYFGAESVLKATEGRLDILAHVGRDNFKDLAAAAWGFATTKLKNVRTNEKFDLQGVYRNVCVNDYGEIGKKLFPREGNILATGYLNDVVNYSTADISQEFIDYVNDYVAYCKRRGATVYYSFSPVNARAVRWDSLREDTEKYYAFLSEKLDCEVISDPLDYVYDYRYFYDTNFHLNDSGAVLRTVQLVRDLKTAQSDPSAIDAELPPPPAPQYQQREIDFTLEYTPSEMFVYEETENGYLSIVGVTDGAREQEEIVLPVIHDNKYVISVRSGALKDCKNLTEVTVPVGISQLDNAVFEGCASLRRIRILETSQDNIAVSDGLLSGVSEDCRIVIVNAAVSDFGTGYFWSRYVGYLVQGD